MRSHVARIPARMGVGVPIFLCSDLHLGHKNANVRRIHAELSRAVERGASIFINGDVFDCVTFTDRKRYQPGQTIRRIAESRNSFDATVEYGVEILAPYRKHIRAIGIGNHEESWLKYRESEPVTEVVGRLNALLRADKSKHAIHEAGISGFLVTLLDVPSGKGKPLTLSHTIHYHHGSGGDAPVTGGLIGAERHHVAVIADCYTQGHRHNLVTRERSVMTCRPNGRVVHKQVLHLLTGSYLDNYKGGKAAPLDYTYAESANHQQKPLGGHFLVLTPERSGNSDRPWRVRQDHHSALLPR